MSAGRRTHLSRQRVMFVFGTRPEAIKLAPLILHARGRPHDFETCVCVTAQHRQMLDQVLELFGICPDVDLDLMRPGQDLFDVTCSVLIAMRPVLRERRPDWVLVQGDTTTVWTAALAAFYENVRVGHVEAGLRTFDKRQPFPEEINRRLCTQLADLHFAPTPRSRDNLLAERVPPERVLVTGNTVIDALLWMLERIERDPPAAVRELQAWTSEHVGEARLVLITGHRRESFGEGFENICAAIAELARRHPEVHWVYPVHLNPNVQQPVRRVLGNQPNVHLLEPLSYAPFCWLMKRCALILTDSGGVQEEAPSLGRFVLVMRNTTERPEGVEAGVVRLVGNRRDAIVHAASEALDQDRSASATVAASNDGPPFPAPNSATQPTPPNPYGDGRASRRIADAILAAASF
ncbi:MAG: UDP-N-acetylglucosamine 2-epimerase (non-hydrolyzing) [Phycisphaerae bacterium]|nr:UDP-N-acetylglucosamine 2-epimerase (non-hydrolyzing) [Phycisphaerae bacterium]